jgi:hypothetical protein
MTKKMLMAVVVLVSLTGCVFTGVSTGSRKTTFYDQEGRATHTVDDAKAVGDPNTEMYEAISEVSRQTAANIKARADAIKDVTQEAATDSEQTAAWKAAFRALAIAQIDDTTARNIAAVPKAKTGYDVADSAVGAVKDIATVGLPVYGAVKAVKYLAQQAGDSTSVTMEGDGNSYRSSKTHINNEVTSSVSGDESTGTVSGAPTGATASPTTSEITNEAATPAAETTESEETETATEPASEE